MHGFILLKIYNTEYILYNIYNVSISIYPYTHPSIHPLIHPSIYLVSLENLDWYTKPATTLLCNWGSSLKKLAIGEVGGNLTFFSQDNVLRL